MDASFFTPAARRLLLVVLVASATFLLRLDCALLEPEEIRYAEIAREMLAADQWIVPLHHGQPYYDKPPLLYWLLMLGYSVFGVHDWAARLAPGCCGVIIVLITYAWGRRMFGERTAFWGALLLALTPRFIYLGRFVAMDSVLSACLAAGLASLHVAISGPQRCRWWMAGGLACGLGLLAKGPVALVLLWTPVLAHLLASANAYWPRATRKVLSITFFGSIMFNGSWNRSITPSHFGFMFPTSCSGCFRGACC